MKTPKKVQIDMFGKNDPRSVSAMLHGKGDGREKLYQHYARQARLHNPALTDLELTYMYERDAKDPGLVRKLKLIAALRSMGFQVLGVITTYLVLHQFFG